MVPKGWRMFLDTRILGAANVADGVKSPKPESADTGAWIRYSYMSLYWSGPPAEGSSSAWLTPWATYVVSVDRREALQLLGLPENANPEKVRTRFRELAMQLHPDRAKMDPDAFIRLQEARAAALGEDDGAALVPLNQVTELVRAATDALAQRDERRERREESESVKQQVMRARTSPLKIARRRVSFLTGLMTFLAGLAQLIRAVPSTAANDVATFTGSVLGIYAAVFGLLIWRNTQRITRIEEAVEDATETLSERPTFLQAIREITQSAPDSDPWTRDLLLDLVDEWSESHLEQEHDSVLALLLSPRRATGQSLPNCARVIGARDFVKLLIAKGKELRLLAEHEEWIESDLVLTYTLSIGPDGREN